MASVLALVSKGIFEKAHPSAAIGAPLPFTVYASANKALEPLGAGGDLYLVTVRPGDELWLVGILRAPKFDGERWSAKASTVPVTAAQSALSKLRFATGKGIQVEPGKLGMSLQTPRTLTAEDVAVLEALVRGGGAKRPAASAAQAPRAEAQSKKPTAPAPALRPEARAKKAASAPAPALRPEARAREPAAAAPPPVALVKSAPVQTKRPALGATAVSPPEVEGILAGRMERAIGAVRELARTAGPSVADAILPWVDLDKWRSTEATSFWVYTYFLLMRFGEARHLKVLRRAPPHKSSSQMHEALLRYRRLVAEVIELRAMPKARKWTEEPLPKTRADVMAHIAKRLGDPRWKQGKELVAFAAKPSFSLHGEEGLHVFAALLLHAEREDLAPLKGLARQEPIFAQILSAHGEGGASTPDGDRGESLRRQVLEDPASDDHRAVYADWLLEQGDPRGEVIAAQLAGKAVKIDDKSALAWAGEVRAKLRWRAPFANEKPFHVPRFSRGFLSGAAVDSLDGATAGSPDWATVEILDVHGNNIDRIGDYDLRSLAVLGGLNEKNLDAVLGCPELAARLVGVGVRFPPRDQSGLVWDKLARLPRLRFLALGRFAPLPVLVTHPLMKQLELLALHEDKRTPREVRDQVTVLGTYLSSERWLPHYDVLMKHLGRR